MRKVSKLVKFFVFMGISFVICLIGLYTFAYFSPPIELKTANQFQIYDENDEMVFQGSGNNEWVSIDNISQYVIDAVISTEDKTFYSHHGFDYLRIAKTMFNNIKSGDITAGASTISQQYIKNMFLTFDQKWSRKIEEAFLTLRLEVHYSKDDILEGYLNTINYGNGNYGIENASHYYFNKNASELTLEEAIILTGIPKNPSKYNPISSMDNAISRGKLVANAMAKNNKLSETEVSNLFTEEIAIYGKRENNNLQTVMYYQDAVINELKTLTNIPTSLLSSGGLKIYTNLSIKAQTELENSIIKNMENSSMEVASIIINPNNGRIMALTGGYDYAKSQYNRATTAQRQVGSTMKPILYYAALENSFVSSSTFTSEPTTFVFSNNKTYSPQNYNEKYGNKDITMAAAISYSDNIYAVKTHLFLGEEMLVDMAERMGIKKKLQAIPSLPLGTDELTMIDFANAYTTLASGGYKRDLSFIRRVEDINGKVLYEQTEENNLVLNPNYTYILNELLTGTYNSAFMDYNTPTVLSVATGISRKYAVKTGTTDTDCWMVGYNPDLLMLVWNGNDDSSKVEVADGAISKKIWTETVEAVLKDTDSKWYDTPSNVVGIIQNAVTGEPSTNLKRSTVFYYLKGTEPSAITVSKETKKQ